MRPRLVLRRNLPRPAKAANASRNFMKNSSALHNSRPQLPFLSIPSFQRQQWRYLTTDRKRWIKRELLLSVKYSIYVWAILGFGGAAYWAIAQEQMERQHPTPHEWSLRTRMLLRGALTERDRKDAVATDWVMVFQMLRDVLEKLEDPNIEGASVKDLPHDHPAGSKDITALPEAWRRGYFETLLAYAKASEHVDGWVRDTTRGILFPPEVVIGPSNPNPKPIPPGAKSAPKEEDCESTGFPSPDELYLKLLSTDGFTSKQRMEAALSYATWLEYKQLLGPASIIYEDAVNIAIEEKYTPGAPVLLDPKSGILNEKAGKPSANLLTSLTALATFKARHEDVSSALPIMISILKARRSLPTTPNQAPFNPLPAGETGDNWGYKIWHITQSLFKPPAYPPPPDDGTSPPMRDPKELCKEAALHLHIGEIMYTAQNAAREDGVGWTREAVDIAEEQLHKLGRATTDTVAKTTCRECLGAGLENWATMVARLMDEEERKKAAGLPAKSSSSWFGLWGDGKTEDNGRWAAEEKVVKERIRRAREVLEDLESPNRPFGSMFQV